MAKRKRTTEIIIQVNPQASAVLAQAATDDFIKATQAKLKEVTELIKSSWEGMVKDISRLSSPPAEVGLEFGIDVGAEGGVPFITKGSIGANFKISIIWRKGGK
ncbi:MAG TPA: CU044_2847 family protein [Xanthobacteraceae bacterium]|nr:CU044_2847 family protein [Xanthobacteraceae bacterium]